jgi:hypothetical protein
MNSFQIISILFLLYFIYNIYYYSVIDSLFKTILLWATVVVATPLPSAAVLLSFPMKIFLNIPMYISQIIASILSLLLIFTYTSYAPQIIKTIVEQQMYSIFFISIVSSVVISKWIDHVIDRNVNIEIFLLLTIISFVLVYIYKIHVDKLNISI